MDYDKYLIDSQEEFDGVDQDDDYEERKEQYEQDIAEGKWERMNE